MGFDEVVGLDAEGHKGGIVMAWSTGFQIQVLSISPNWVHLKVESPFFATSFIPAVYRPHNSKIDLDFGILFN